MLPSTAGPRAPRRTPAHVPGSHTRAGNAMNRTRAGLLAGAAQAFADQGLRRSTMQSVAAAAGVAGGLLIAHRRSRAKRLGIVPVPRGTTMKSVGEGLLRATENVGRAGDRVGQFSEEVRRVREGLEAGGTAKRRSPIEVVLYGLTHRPS